MDAVTMTLVVWLTEQIKRIEDKQVVPHLHKLPALQGALTAYKATLAKLEEMESKLLNGIAAEYDQRDADREAWMDAGRELSAGGL